MRQVVMRCTLAAIVIGAAIGVQAGEKKRFESDVSEWSSATAATPTQMPIGGSGQVNGDFVVSERNGIQVGIRASRRFSQNVDPLPNVREKNTGAYLVETGTSDAQGRALWNYDLHVDLRGGFGVAKGKTLDDYTLVLETDIGETIFDFEVPIDLGEDWIAPFRPDGGVVLFQTSQNPKFGNPPFNADAEGTYDFTLRLTPKTFKGAPIEAHMMVLVVDED